jgi:hypothetical protein
MNGAIIATTGAENITAMFTMTASTGPIRSIGRSVNIN